jgi:transposase
MDDKQELRLRRKAIRLYVKGIRPKVILKKVQRSRAWFSKWQKRFDRQGVMGLRSRSCRPHHIPITCSPRIERLIVRTRRRLINRR